MKSYRRVALLAVLGTAATAARTEVLQYHPNSPAFIGGNFDPSYPGRAYPECLVRTTVRAESLLPGQRPGTAAATQFFLKKVTSRKELYRLLNVSLSLSGSYGLFSADFSGSLEQENTFAEDSFTWIIQGYTNFGKFLLERTALDGDALALRNNFVGFRNRCGTDYVAQEVRAAQATAVFTIKNLSESERRILEAKLSASYGSGPASVGVDAGYRDFLKTAATYGQIEVKVYALGGPGVSALAPIMSNVDKPDQVISTIQKYFETLTLEQSVAVAYNTGSLQSLINRPSIEMDVYNKYVADTFAAWEDLGAEQRRLQAVTASASDWGITDAMADDMRSEVSRLEKLRRTALEAALACKDAFTSTNTQPAVRRQRCSPADQDFTAYRAKFKGITPKPYYLRYFVTNELIPGEEVLNFSVRGTALKSVRSVKKLAPSGASFEDINSVQIQTAADGSRVASTSLVMSDIPDADLPVGLRIELDSGTVHFEPFAFTRAPVVLSSHTSPFFSAPGPRLPARDDKAAFGRAQAAGETLPAEWREGVNSPQRENR